ncbi:peptidylprolyl isomerase [Mucilaginibacter terrigena]|uniref:Peptidyl-prolyl cis-trans isomerase n=1 Tax=Mucilaginibacter terrigena TaxID=2492395 RepID=A0A4Q5LIL5_9SPHI|nr:FKBP-type peptidyl-prolyl cis-trans isomerase [Mucilaginibacter terrigena]RYU87927.1 peptidylprolyl isomerase [Mucilaginibacter terrigena]
MKKYFFILSMLAVGLASCSKSDPGPVYDPVAQAKADDGVIKAYLASHTDITATKDTSGLYYQIITEGTGPVITNDSKVKVSYVGTDINGVKFDQREDYTTTLSASTNIIAGWKIGVPKVKVGGKILLIIPSTLAYGPYSNGPIPPNSVIIFVITVKELVTGTTPI